MNIANNHSNFYYVEWKFITCINIYRDCILIIFNKRTQQGVGALWEQFSQNSVHIISNLSELGITELPV